MSLTVEELISTIEEDPAAVRESLELIKRTINDLPAMTEVSDADAWAIRDAAQGVDQRITAAVLASSLPTGAASAEIPRNDDLRVDTMADLQALDTADARNIYVLGFYYVGDGGGGLFYYDGSEDQANHDGGSVIDPNHSVAPGSSGWWTSENTGTGCWKRPEVIVPTPDMFGATTDSADAANNTAALTAFANSGYEEVHFPRLYVTDDTITFTGSVEKITGRSMYGTGISCTNPDVATFSLDMSAGWSVHNLRASHSSKGVGDGFLVSPPNRSFSMYNCLATSSKNGFHFNDTVFVANLSACRSMSNDTGYKSTNSQGNSTAFYLDQCYATDVSIRGFEFEGCHSVYLNQPIQDVNNADCSGFIHVKQCSVTTIKNAHVEGSSSITGTIFSASGSTTDTFIVDGAHVDVQAANADDWDLLYLDFAGNVRAKLDGIDSTKSENLTIYRARNNSGDYNTITITNDNRFGSISTRDISGVGGELKVNNPPAIGRATGASSGDILYTGLHYAPDSVVVTLDPGQGNYPSVYPAVDDALSGGRFSVRFVNISDGSADTSGSHDIYWQAYVTSR